MKKKEKKSSLEVKKKEIFENGIQVPRLTISYSEWHRNRDKMAREKRNYGSHKN